MFFYFYIKTLEQNVQSAKKLQSLFIIKFRGVFYGSNHLKSGKNPLFYINFIRLTKGFFLFSAGHLVKSPLKYAIENVLEKNLEKKTLLLS